MSNVSPAPDVRTETKVSRLRSSLLSFFTVYCDKLANQGWGDTLAAAEQLLAVVKQGCGAVSLPDFWAEQAMGLLTLKILKNSKQALLRKKLLTLADDSVEMKACLAYCFLHGIGGEKDERKGVTLLIEALDPAGPMSRSAAECAAWLYREGCIVGKDPVNEDFWEDQARLADFRRYWIKSPAEQEEIAESIKAPVGVLAWADFLFAHNCLNAALKVLEGGCHSDDAELAHEAQYKYVCVGRKAGMPHYGLKEQLEKAAEEPAPYRRAVCLLGAWKASTRPIVPDKLTAVRSDVTPREEWLVLQETLYAQLKRDYEAYEERCQQEKERARMAEEKALAKALHRMEIKRLSTGHKIARWLSFPLIPAGLALQLFVVCSLLGVVMYNLFAGDLFIGYFIVSTWWGAALLRICSFVLLAALWYAAGREQLRSISFCAKGLVRLLGDLLMFPLLVMASLHSILWMLSAMSGVALLGYFAACSLYFFLFVRLARYLKRPVLLWVLRMLYLVAGLAVCVSVLLDGSAWEDWMNRLLS